MMKKKNLFFRWIALVILCLAGFMTAGAYDVFIGGIYYNVTEYSDGSAVASVQNNGSLNTYAGYVAIPDSITYNSKRVPVTGIGYQAFKGCTTLTGVLIPEGVTMMLNEAFAGCTSLQAITLPTTMYSIYNSVFTGCTNLFEIRCMRPTAVSCNANNFDANTYSNADLYVSYGSLESYQNTTPWSQFSHKTHTQQFVVDGICYRRMGGNNVKVTYKDTSFGSYQGNIIVPPTVTYNGVTYNVVAVDDYAFYGCTNLYSVELPSTITSIGANAFGNTFNSNTFILHCMATVPPAVQSNTFPSTIPENTYLFVPYESEQAYLDAAGWSSFGQDYIFGTYDFIEDGNYYHVTSPTTVSACAKAVNPFTYTFFYRDDYYTLTDAIIPATVTHDDVTYQVTEIGQDAFGGCYNLKTVTLPEGIQKIGFGAFYDDRELESINFPNTLTEIDGYAFIYNLSLTEINIPNSVKTIGDVAFYQCYGLETITLGSGLEYVGYEAFHMGDNLVSVTCYALVPPVTPEDDPDWQDELFTWDDYRNATLYVPKSSLSAYQTALGWKDFRTMVTFVNLDDALNVTGGTIHFDSDGDYPWQVVSEGDRDYAQSGNNGVQSSSSILTATVTVEKTSTLSFDYKAWGEENSFGTIYDACIFSLDDETQFTYGAADNDWTTFSLELSPGTHTLTWCYTKDSSVNPTGDYFAIDNVAIKAKAVRGDVDGDGSVTMDDLAALINYLLTDDSTGINMSGADADISGDVGMDDLAALINYLLTDLW